jgi:hypothetical protein
MNTAPSLEQQRSAFCQRRFLAVPLAGAICWAVIGIASPFFDTFGATMLVYGCTGAIVYVGVGLSRLTGEPFFRREPNAFDRLFMVAMGTQLLVFAIAIPFAMAQPRAVTLGLGILSVLAWTTFSWITQTWIGYFHAVARTVLVLAGWLLFPAHHFQVVPGIIVALYALTILVLEKRWQRIKVAAT